jgi:hypothetical protein
VDISFTIGLTAAAGARDPRSPKARRKDRGNKYFCRDDLATSGAVTLVGDAARTNDRARSAYTRQVGTYLELLIKLIAADKHRSKEGEGRRRVVHPGRRHADGRAVNDENLSRECSIQPPMNWRRNLGDGVEKARTQGGSGRRSSGNACALREVRGDD